MPFKLKIGSLDARLIKVTQRYPKKYPLASNNLNSKKKCPEKKI